MNKRALLVLVAAVIVSVVIIVVLEESSGNKNDPIVDRLRATADSFGAPSNSTPGRDDTSASSPPTVTRFWTSSQSIDIACDNWRDAYRGWIGTDKLGDVTGNYRAGQSCTYTGPKDGAQATLQVAVYGTDPQPTITLTVTKRP